jgi:hypothetical protein
MRSLVICFLFGLIVIGCKNGENKALASETSVRDSSKFTTIQWLDSIDKDFGKITEGQKLEVSFHFKNTGNYPLVIEKVRPSCGCTVPEESNEPVAPGNEGVIRASFNSEGKIGPNHKTLYVTANTKGNQNHELQFEVQVEKKKW